MTPQTNTLPPKPETEEDQDAQGGCLQQPCSSLDRDVLINLAAGEGLKPSVVISEWNNPLRHLGVKGALIRPSVVLKILELHRNAGHE
jgi:hypothetical protein